MTAIEYQRTENDVMKINIRAGDRGMSFLIPMTMIEAEFDENRERYALSNEFPVVNAAWMIDIFTPDPDKNSLN